MSGYLEVRRRPRPTNCSCCGKRFERFYFHCTDGACASNRGSFVEGSGRTEPHVTF